MVKQPEKEKKDDNDKNESELNYLIWINLQFISNCKFIAAAVYEIGLYFIRKNIKTG